MLFYEDYRYYDEYTIDDAMNFVQESQNSYNSFIDYCIEQEQICLQETGKEEYITEGAIKDIFRRVIELITGLIKRIREALGRLFKKLPKPITTKPSGNNSSSNTSSTTKSLPTGSNSNTTKPSGGNSSNSNNNSNSTTRSLPAGSNGNTTKPSGGNSSNSNNNSNSTTRSLPAGSNANANTKSLPPAKPKTYHITYSNVEKIYNVPLFGGKATMTFRGVFDFKELKDLENFKNDTYMAVFMDEGFDADDLETVTLINYGHFGAVDFYDVNSIDKFKEYLNKEVFDEKYEDNLTMENIIKWNKQYYETAIEAMPKQMNKTKYFEELKSNLESMQKKFSNVTKENYNGDNYELAMKNLTKYITTLGQWCTIICSYQTTMATMFVQYISKKINQMNHIINND